MDKQKRMNSKHDSRAEWSLTLIAVAMPLMSLLSISL